MVDADAVGSEWREAYSAAACFGASVLQVRRVRVGR
jgi:hypothetical protein